MGGVDGVKIGLSFGGFALKGYIPTYGCDASSSGDGGGMGLCDECSCRV